jgi:hypothetical protein
MKFYHGTTEKAWKEIKNEGVLWGRKNKYHGKIKLARVTWLAKDKENAGIYNDKGLTNKKCGLLEVDFPDVKDWHKWQMTCYKPIKIDRVRRIK